MEPSSSVRRLSHRKHNSEIMAVAPLLQNGAEPGTLQSEKQVIVVLGGPLNDDGE